MRARLGPRSRAWLAVAAVGAAIALAHGGALSAQFAGFDDNQYVVRNPSVMAGATRASFEWAVGFSHRGPYFHPLTWLSLIVNRELLGPAPWGFHLVNVLLHFATSTLLLLFLVRASGRWFPALVAALVFAVHPLTVEPVAWIAERKALLAGFFGLSAIYAYALHAERPSRRRMATVIALLIASLLSKPGLNVFPVLALVLDFWPLRRLAGTGREVRASVVPPLALRSAILEKVPMLVAAALLLALAVRSSADLEFYGDAPPPAGAVAGTGWQAPPGVRVANAIAVIPRYLGAFVLPSGLAVLHPYPVSVPAARVWLGLAVVLGLSLAAAATWRSRPWIATGWGWFMVTLVPFLGLKQGGLWPGWGERFAYVPMMGLALVFGFALEDLARRRTALRAVAAATAIAVAVALTVACRAQVRHWHDAESLFRRGVAVEPTASEMHSGLGAILLASHREDEAAHELGLAASLAPWNTSAQTALGDMLAARGRQADAEDRYRQALRWDPNDPDALLHLARLLMSVGRQAEARPFLLRRASVLASEPPGSR